MKRCPECRRDYYDDTLTFCLDDGTRLIDGPANTASATAILPGGQISNEAPTRLQIKSDDQTTILPLGGERTWNASFQGKRWPLIFLMLALLISGAFLAYHYFLPDATQIGSTTVDVPKPTLYWEMTEAEQMVFIRDRARHVQGLIGDEQADLDPEAITAIRVHIGYYVERKDSLSQKPFEEGLRAIYGRASQFAPIVIRSYETQKAPAALGLYQAMVESEYHDCPELEWEHPDGGTPVGLFQFSRKTAAVYGMKTADYCDVQKQCDAAARYMSDLISDFGSEKSSWTLALFSFNQGPNQVRDYLRQLRSHGVTERSFWVVFHYQKDLQPAMTEEANRYVPRFFAAAIIGETPEAFDLSTPPLTTLRVK